MVSLGLRDCYIFLVKASDVYNIGNCVVLGEHFGGCTEATRSVTLLTGASWTSKLRARAGSSDG